MERIYKHIERLLARNEYVVIPEWGGFVLQYEPARIVDSVLYPPRKMVAFNSLMCHSDGLLEIEIARAEQISFRNARQLVAEELEKFKSEIGIKKQSVFGKFGRFTLEESGAFVFYPSFDSTFIPANTGLKTILLQSTDKFADQKSVTPRSISIRNVLRYAAMVVLVLGMLFITEKVNKNTETQSASFVSFATSGLNSKAKVNAVAKPVAKITAVENRAEGLFESDLYHVVVASLPSMHSAEVYCKMLQLKSFATAHILKPVKTYRVAIKSFADRSEAIAYMEDLRKSDPIFESAWVLCK